MVQGDRVLLNYTTGVPECYGAVVVGPVREGRRSVTVTLRAVPPPQPADACIDLAVTGTRVVDLFRPLGRRWVLDGGFAPEVPVRQVTRPYERLDAGPAARTR